MGEASALALYSDLGAMSAEDAFRLGHADGAAAAAANFPAVIFGLFSLPECVERMCDPDAMPGSARPKDAGPAWEAPPTISAEAEAGRALAAQSIAEVPEAAGFTPLDAYMRGFQCGVRAALDVVQRAAASLHDFHAQLAA